MPYIQNDDRIEFFGVLNELEDNFKLTSGELNYLISSICSIAWKNGEGRYEDINRIIGALECAKQEFYRRVAIPFEETKIKENGDIY